MFTLCQKIVVFLVFLWNPSIVQVLFLIFVFTSTKSFSRIFSRNRSAPKSFSRSVAQSFNHIYTHIVEMGYFVAHSTWRYRVLGDTRYCVTQGTIWRRVLCGARYYMAQGWQFFLIPSDAKQRTNIHKKADQTNKAKKIRNIKIYLFIKYIYIIFV